MEITSRSYKYCIFCPIIPNLQCGDWNVILKDHVSDTEILGLQEELSETAAPS